MYGGLIGLEIRGRRRARSRSKSYVHVDSTIMDFRGLPLVSIMLITSTRKAHVCLKYILSGTLYSCAAYIIISSHELCGLLPAKPVNLVPNIIPLLEGLEEQNYQYSRSLGTFHCFYFQISLFIVETTVCLVEARIICS